MERQAKWIFIVVLFLAAGGMLLINAAPAEAQNGTDPLILGARLYDDWIAETGQPAPSGNQPLWSTQTTNTISGADTWRCAACHGWDYQGADGAYSSGANFTGFPGVYPARKKSSAELMSILTGGTNADHNFSSFLSDSELEALVTFIQSGLVNDSEFIDRATLKVINGDAAHGEALYSQACSECHGADGTTIQFRQGGQMVLLGTLANQDPWRFLHRTRFGLARAPEMKIGQELGWSVQDGRDVLLFAQSLPAGISATAEPAMQDVPETAAAQPGGPANSIFTGILTALGAMATSLGFALILGGLLVGVLLVVVWFMRNKQ